MGFRTVAVASLLGTVMLLFGLSSVASSEDEHFLDFSQDNFKVVFISGNLTAAVTHDWPRIVFEHSSALLSPTFEVGFPRLYLFNDSNLDGMFVDSEAQYIGFLDENHVTWSLTTVAFDDDLRAGEYARFRMNSTVSLFRSVTNDTPEIQNWANVTFYFRINELNLSGENSYGTYSHRGKIELMLNFTLSISKKVNTSGVVFEQLLQGGGSTYLFLIMQMDSLGNTIQEPVSSRENEKDLYGSDFAHRYMETSSPMQTAYYSKDDHTIQAFYNWDSEPMMMRSGEVSPAEVNASYFTTGTGLVIRSSYSLSNETDTIYQQGSIGIEESGFIVKIRDWFQKNLTEIVIASALIAILVVLTLVYAYRGRRKQKEDKEADQPPPTRST